MDRQISRWRDCAPALVAGLVVSLVQSSPTAQSPTPAEGVLQAELTHKKVNPAQSRFLMPKELPAANAVMTGSIADTQITLVDMDGDGEWNEIGKDAMVIGNAPAAAYVSETANLGGKLYQLSISKDGKQVTAKPYTELVGTLDMKTEFKCFGNLQSLIVKDASGKNWFNMAGKKSLLVPVGRYTIDSGLVRKDKEIARIVQGKMPEIPVTTSSTTVVKWGSAITAEFNIELGRTELTVQPDLKFYGRGGEEYVNFQPDLKSPKFFVYDAKTKKLIASGRYGGC